MAESRSEAEKAQNSVRDLGASVADSAREAGEMVNRNLKAVGVDTEVMAEAAKDKAGELQEMLIAEIRKRPLHALGLAAFVGFWFGVRR